MRTEPLGHWIRQRREQHGWTQAKLADLLGTDAMTISRWERSVNAPRAELLQQLSRLLGSPSDQPPVGVSIQEQVLDRLDEMTEALRALERTVSELRDAQPAAARRERLSPAESADVLAEAEKYKPQRPGTRRRTRRADRPDASPNPGPAKP